MMRWRATVHVLVIAAIAAPACSAPAQPTSPTVSVSPVAQYTLTLTGTSPCPARIRSVMSFSMALTESGDVRTFTLVEDLNWLPEPGVPALALSLPATGSSIAGQLRGGVTEQPFRGFNWLVFNNPIAVSSADGMAGGLDGTILYNQLSPGAFSVRCDASSYTWALTRIPRRS